jgi:hypothetical protein
MPDQGDKDAIPEKLLEETRDAIERLRAYVRELRELADREAELHRNSRTEQDLKKRTHL